MNTEKVMHGVIKKAHRGFTAFVLVVAFLVSTSASTALAADPVNLVPNPSLEDSTVVGIPDFWLKGAWGTNNAIFDYPETGNTGVAASLQVTDHVDGDAKWYFEPVSVVPGDTYVFSDYFIADSPTEIDAAFTMEDGTMTYMYLTSLASTEGLWQRSEQSFVAPAGSASVTLFHLIVANGTLAIDDYSLIHDSGLPDTDLSKGMVSLTFDDGWTSQYDNALPILQENRMRGSFFIITQPMKDADEVVADGGDYIYMTTAQVLALQEAGNEVGDHTVYHCNLVTRLCPDGDPPNSPDTINRNKEINNARKDLLAAGVNSVDTIAYPYGEYNNRVITILKNSGFLAGRSVESGYNTATSNKYALKVQNVDASTTFEDVKGWIDTARENDYWLILTFHQVENVLAPDELYGTSTQLFSDITSYIKSQQMTVVTMREGLQMMN